MCTLVTSTSFFSWQISVQQCRMMLVGFLDFLVDKNLTIWIQKSPRIEFYLVFFLICIHNKNRNVWIRCPKGINHETKCTNAKWCWILSAFTKTAQTPSRLIHIRASVFNPRNCYWFLNFWAKPMFRRLFFRHPGTCETADWSQPKCCTLGEKHDVRGTR